MYMREREMSYFVNNIQHNYRGLDSGVPCTGVDSTGARARLTLIYYNIIIACSKVQFRRTDRSQSGEALEF